MARPVLVDAGEETAAEADQEELRLALQLYVSDAHAIDQESLLVATARTQLDDPTVFVRNRELFGDLVDHPRFVAAYVEALDSLHAQGAHATVIELAGSDLS